MKKQQEWQDTIMRTVRRIYNKVRFGKVTAHVIGTAGHYIEAEVEYRDKRGKLVGFWAYGSWHPGYPYKE
jgi:hypothetical protein